MTVCHKYLVQWLVCSLPVRVCPNAPYICSCRWLPTNSTLSVSLRLFEILQKQLNSVVHFHKLNQCNVSKWSLNPPWSDAGPLAASYISYGGKLQIQIQLKNKTCNLCIAMLFLCVLFGFKVVLELCCGLSLLETVGLWQSVCIATLLFRFVEAFHSIICHCVKKASQKS